MIPTSFFLRISILRKLAPVLIYVSILILSFLLSISCFAEDSPVITIEHVPPGERVVIEGVGYIAYDLEALKRLAEFDRLHGNLQKREGLLKQKLELRDEQILLLEEDLLETGRELKKIRDQMNSALPVHPVPSPLEDEESPFWSQTNHLIIEAALISVIIIGGSYALAF